MDTFLRVNGHRIGATTDEAEAIVLGVAAGTVTRDEFTAWVRRRVVPMGPPGSS
jgi:prophage maintenance system killer protein